jgi:hypothetical protein
MIILSRQRLKIMSVEGTYMTAGTNDLLPPLLRNIPSNPPAHHKTPLMLACVTSAKGQAYKHGMLHILIRPRSPLVHRKSIDDTLPSAHPVPCRNHYHLPKSL